MSKRTFNKKLVEQEIRQMMKQGASRHEILEDLSSLYTNPTEIATLVASMHTNKTKISKIKLDVK